MQMTATNAVHTKPYPPDHPNSLSIKIHDLHTQCNTVALRIV